MRPTLLRLGLGLLAALALVLPASAIHAQPAPAAPSLTDSLTWDPAVRRGVLPNGIRFFIKKNVRPEARVSLRLAVPVGSTAEADDQQGVAHFTEHMNFNGSAHFKDADDLVGYLRSIGLRFGADANAYTSFDETVYMLDVPTDKDSLLVTGLNALSDFAGRATMSDKEIDKERGVVMEEWRLGRGAQERIQRQQFPVLFHDSRYALRLPIGKPEIIQGVAYARLRDFYRTWYRPEWMAVIAVGDVDPDKMERLIRDRFSDLPKRTDAKDVPRYDVPPHDQTLMSIVSDKEATSSSVALVVKRPRRPENSVLAARNELKADLFSAMLNARFDEIAHRANPPFLSAFAGNFQFTRSVNLYFAQAETEDGKQAKGFDALLEETARVRAHGFLPSELDRARKEQAAELDRAYAEREKTESRGIAASMVRSYLNGEPETGIEASTKLSKALLPGITLEEVNALADSLVSTRNRVVLAYGPEKAGAPLPTEAELRSILDKSASEKPAAWVDKAAGQTLMARLPAPGKIVSRRTIDEIGVTVVKFENGLEAWLKPTDFKADEITFTAYAPGGLSLADSAAFVSAWMSPFIVNDNGVGGFKNTELQKMLAGKLLRVVPYASAYTHGVSGNTRPEDLETLLQLLNLGFVKPTEDPEAFAALQAQFNAFLTNRANSPDQVYADSANAVNTGGLYLSRTPTAAQARAVKLDAALAFYRKAFATAGDFTVFFAGTLLRVVPYASAYTHGVSGNTRPEDLETLLQLLNLGFVKPTEDPEAFAALQAQFNAFLTNRANSPDQVYADSANAVNTGGLYLSRTPTAAQASAVKLDAALAFYRKAFANAGDFTFFFAGTFKTDSLIPLLARYLGSLPGTGKRTSRWVAIGPRFPAGITKVEVKKGSEPKGSVRITYFTRQPIDELDQHRANSAASILTDHLRSSLRELLGGTYSVSARFQHQIPLNGYSTMTIAFGCDPARADTLIAATQAEIQKLIGDGPSAEDVSKEQEVQRRELETNAKQNGYWTGSMQTVSLLGWDPKRIAKRRERIDLLTPANLRDTFKEYFPADHYSIVRLAPETKATP